MFGVCGNLALNSPSVYSRNSWGAGDAWEPSFPPRSRKARQSFHPRWSLRPWHSICTVHSIGTVDSGDSVGSVHAVPSPGSVGALWSRDAVQAWRTGQSVSAVQTRGSGFPGAASVSFLPLWAHWSFRSGRTRYSRQAPESHVSLLAGITWNPWFSRMTRISRTAIFLGGEAEFFQDRHRNPGVRADQHRVPVGTGHVVPGKELHVGHGRLGRNPRVARTVSRSLPQLRPLGILQASARPYCPTRFGRREIPTTGRHYMTRRRTGVAIFATELQVKVRSRQDIEHSEGAVDDDEVRRFRREAFCGAHSLASEGPLMASASGLLF